MLTNMNDINNPDHEISVIGNQYITKQHELFYLRETGIFITKRYVTDKDGKELFKYNLPRNGCILYESSNDNKNKIPLLNIKINSKNDEEINIYLGQDDKKAISSLRKNSNLNCSHGEKSYSVYYFNLVTQKNEFLDIIYNDFKKEYSIFISNENNTSSSNSHNNNDNKNSNNRILIGKIKRSGRKFTLEISGLVDYLFMIAVNLCLLKFADLEELKTFEQSDNTNQSLLYQYQ